MIDSSIYNNSEYFKESIQFFEDFNFKFQMKENDQTPQKNIYHTLDEKISLNEPFTLTPLATKAMNQQLSSPNQDSEEIQNSIKRQTPFTGDFISEKKSSSKFLDETDICIDQYTPFIDTIKKKDRHQVLDLTNTNISIIKIENKENLGDKMNFHCSKWTNGSLKLSKKDTFLNGYIKGNNIGDYIDGTENLFESLKSKLNTKQSLTSIEDSIIDKNLSKKTSTSESTDGSTSTIQNRKKSYVEQKSNNILYKMNNKKLDNKKPSCDLEDIENVNSLRIGDYIWHEQDAMLDNTIMDLLNKVNSVIKSTQNEKDISL